MDFEWDNSKDAANRRKHGFSLADGIGVFGDSKRLELIDDREDYGEIREVAIGISKGRLLIVVFVERGDNVFRLISVRKATRHEARLYHTHSR